MAKPAAEMFGRIVLPGKSPKTVPAFFYGTAWKKENTTSLVDQAIKQGFTAIDTACQPRHYREDLVGEAVRKSQKPRSELFIQTKFTAPAGHDANIPYDPRAPIQDQVHQSLAKSFQHFTFNDAGPCLDSVLMHSPLNTLGDTLEAWRALESYVPDRIKFLGISNVTIHILMDLYERATIKPTFIQNRFYADTKYDIAVRKFCEQKGMVYQSFWTLTANPGLPRAECVQDLATECGITREQALYCLVVGLNVLVLNGTTDEGRMKADLAAVGKVKGYIMQNPAEWEDTVKQFRRLLGEKV